MKFRLTTAVALLAVSFSANSLAQSDTADASPDALKIAALEALVAAPPERALPLARKVLAGENSDEVKIRALFVLSQIDAAEAQSQLLDIARNGSGRIRTEAVRMIGIGGNSDSLAGLAGLYESGDAELKHGILEAYLIADDKAAVYSLAANATNEDEFADAVEILGAMGARDELRQLREQAGMSESLIQAYAISGDFESLRILANDRSDPELQAQAIDGLMIAGDDDGLLDLYRTATSIAEKRKVLEALANMGSDRVIDVIDEALAGDR